MKIQDVIDRMQELQKAGETHVGIVWIDRQLMIKNECDSSDDVTACEWEGITEAMDEADSSAMYDAMIEGLKELDKGF